MNTIIAFLLLSIFFSVKYFFLSSFSPHFHVLLSLSSPSSGWTDPASFPTRLTSEFKYSVHVTSRTLVTREAGPGRAPGDTVFRCPDSALQEVETDPERTNPQHLPTPTEILGQPWFKAVCRCEPRIL